MFREEGDAEFDPADTNGSDSDCPEEGDSLRSHVVLHECLAFYSAFKKINIHRSGVLTVLAWLVPHETAAVLARSVHTIQPCTVSLHAKPHT